MNSTRDAIGKVSWTLFLLLALGFAPRTEAENGAAPLLERNWPARLEVEPGDGEVTVDTGALRFGLTLGEGATLRFVEQEGRRVVSDNTAPLLSATLLESAAYDPAVDFVPDAVFVEGEYRVEDASHETADDVFTARLRGRIAFGADTINFVVDIAAKAGEPHLRTATRLGFSGEFRDRYVRDVRLSLPLALNWRKRIAQGGDRGMSWDTRYYYEFIRSLPTDPDRNEWRHFAVEQAGPDAFTIWRSESMSTAPLIHQRGKRAPGWSGLYDQEGGVLFAYRSMSQHAPKTLWVNAAGGGEAQAHLHPPTAPAFDPRHAESARQVFGETHEVEWVFYPGEHRDARPEDWLANLWEVEQPFAARRPRQFEEVFEDMPDFGRVGASGRGDAPYVRGGVPFARGEFSPDNGVLLWRDGQWWPAQTRPVAYWPDGSVKWLLVVFPLSPDPGATLEPPAGAASTSFEVSLRDDERLDFTLYHAPGLTAPEPSQTVQLTERGNRVEVNTGPLRVALTTGERWLEQVLLNGRPMLREAEGAAPGFVDFLTMEDDYPVGSAHPRGTPDPGALAVEEIFIEEAGPLRAIVRLEGFSGNAEPARVVMRLKFYAGSGLMHLFHTVEFRHDDPRRTFLRRMGLELPLRLDPGTASVTFGGQEGPVQGGAADYAELRQDAPGRYRLLREQGNGLETIEEKRHSRGWMNVSGDGAGAAIVLRDMWKDFPKALAWRGENGGLTASLWPESVPLMDVRRYSDFPHRAQGETTGGDNRWVHDVYYPQDPFVGVARTHELAIAFHDGTVRPEALDALAADVHSPPLVYSGIERYREADITLELPDHSKFPLMSENEEHFTNFFLFHQALHNWYGMWDYGDFQHRFRTGGYGNFVPADFLKEYFSQPEDERQHGTPPGAVGDYICQQDWNFDNGRWGWTNTEGLPGLYLQLEYLRTGRREVFFAAEAMARHSRDVVIRHHGRWFGRGTRHGVQHWSCGHHGERQTVFSEMRFHYYLTGEARTREVMTRLSEEYYNTGRVARNQGNHSARLYGLFTYWEMTGDPVIGERLRDYVHGLIVPEGIATAAGIRFDEDAVAVESADTGINSPGMFFHTFGATHALLEYYQVTRDPDLREALVKMADAWIEGGGRIRPQTQGMVMAFAAANGHEGAREWLEDWVKTDIGFRACYQSVMPPAARWSGDLAYFYGTTPFAMFMRISMPTIMVALGDEPPLSASHEAQMAEEATLTEEQEAQLDEADRRGFRDKRCLRWQTEYDDPELRHFFGPWRPPESAEGAGAALVGNGASRLVQALRADDWEGWQVAEKRLPQDGWRFRTDPDDEGRDADWFDPAHDDADWRTDVPIETSWQPFMDAPYIGAAWYRRDFELPEAAEWERAYIEFRGVDEEAWVWVNGRFVGSNEMGRSGWNVPFLFDITDAVRRDGPNHIAVRARNTVGNGGIWEPVRIRLLAAEPAP